MNTQFLKKLFRSWYYPLKPLLEDKYFKKLTDKLTAEYETNTDIYPKKEVLFKPFKLTDYDDLKVVIVGDRPYCSDKANGLAFGIDENSIDLSSALQNIINVVEQEVYNGFNLSFDSTMESWAKQGILLLNTSLSINRFKNASHYVYWHIFVTRLISIINENKTGIIFCFWGNKTDKLKELVNTNKHYVFDEIGHFNEINTIIEGQNGKEFKIIY